MGTLPAISVAAGESSQVQVTGAFSDPDGDALSHTAATSNAAVATVSVAAGVATVTGVAKGVATISVTATDPGGASAQQNFEVTVPNRAPEPTGTIPAIELAVDGMQTLDVSQYFTDPDGDDLGYAAASSDTALATVAVSGNALTVTAVAAGTATITVTATDPDAASAEQNFNVTVPNRAPERTNTIPDQELAVGDSAVFDLEGYFHDPDGDALSYASETSDEATATVSVSGSTLTVRAVSKGRATILVTAADRGGLMVSGSFGVTVPNQAPVAVGTLPAVRVAVGESSAMRLAGAFSDPDGDALSYSAVTSNADVATVSVSASVATVTGVAKGVATISVTATDPGGASARHVFEVTVPNRAPDTIGTIPAVELAVGETETVDVSQYFTDPDGDALNYAVASSDPALAVVAVSGNALTVTAVAAGTATITVTATDPDAANAEQNFNVTVPNRAPERTDTIPDQELAVGDSAVFDLEDYFHDPDGNPLGYSPETSDEAVVTVSVSGSMLTVRALAKGRATISVTVADRGGLMVSDSFNVTVPNQAPVVTDTIPAQPLTVGDVREWTGSEYFADPDGDALTYAAGTTDASIVLAIVSGGDFGIVAVAPGTATVTVTATDGDGLSGSQVFQVTVQAQAAVTITRVEPTVLIEGAPATIHGSGFSSAPGKNTVLVDGFRAMVTEATSTRLSVTVPYADCRPPRQAQLRVTVGSLTDARTVGVTPVSREDLELPQGFYKVTPAGYGCLHLPGDATGDYLIGVVSTSEVPSTLTPVTMTNTLGDPTVVADFSTLAAAQRLQRAAVPISLSPASYSSVPTAVPSDSRIAEAQSFTPRRDWAWQNDMLARNVDLIRRLGAATPALGRSQQSRAMVTGDTVTLFVDGNPTCTTRSQVRAVVRLVGGNAIWLDDIDNPSSTFTDTELVELDAFYASHVKGVHDDYYGDLTDVDGNDRILILMTKEVNKQDGESSFVEGWVWGADLLPTTTCRTSNEAEIFFGRVPDPDGVFGHARTRQEMLESYPSLLTHEITHLVQFAALLRGGGNTETWALEGGAVLSEQLVAYRVFGHGSGRNLGYAAYERGRRWWYGRWVSGLARFFGWDSDDESGVGRVSRAPEQCTWVGGPEDGNDGPCRGLIRAVYDVPSVLFRYAMDRWGDDYPGGERALMTRLTQSPRRGYAALEEVGSWRIEQILTDFYLSLWLDLYGADALGMKSWDLADVWSRFPANRWLVPYASSSRRFRGDWSVRAGSTSYLRWQPNGSRGPTSLKVTTAGGGRVPNHISVWALRIR